MTPTLRVVLAGWLATFVAPPAFAQELFIYPNKNQGADQQEKDKFACYSWAKSQSGFDPMAPPTTRTAPPKKQGGSVVHGAVVGGAAGAALGAVGGAIAGKAGKGAAIGAGTGGLLGGLVRAGQNQKDTDNEKQWERSEAQAYASSRNGYNRAYSACLEGRGYTVK